ncbi:MAG: CDP-alcohol phosphatidyltransferase family protein [Flavobacteriales bacterium]
MTTANLACGVGSILLASQGQLTLACWLVFAGAFFDVLDGLAARALGGGSPLGAQLDSLADMVTFGVAPGMIAFIIVGSGVVALENKDLIQATSLGDPITSMIFLKKAGILDRLLVWSIPMIITIASCWRLAKFNLDTRQSNGFLGLPTPANGLFWASVGLAVANGATYPAILLIGIPAVPFSVALGLSIVMLSEIPLPSLKFKHFKWAGNEVIFLLLGISLVLVILYGILAVPMILLLYLLSPLWGKLFKSQLTSIK